MAGPPKEGLEEWNAKVMVPAKRSVERMIAMDGGDPMPMPMPGPPMVERMGSRMRRTAEPPMGGPMDTR